MHKGIINRRIKETRQQNYFGLLENVGANRQSKKHRTFKGPVAEVPGIEIFGMYCRPTTCLVSEIMAATELGSV